MNNKDSVTLWNIICTIYCYIDFIAVNILQLICMPVLLLISIFDRDKKLLSYSIKFFYWIFYFLNIPQIHDFDLNGLKAPKKGQRRIYVVNHASIFDVILMSVLPGANKAVMKESYAKLPLIGQIAVLTGNIVLKQDMDFGEQYDFYMSIQEKLERGVPVVIFPEGTRSRTGKMGRFYDGSFKLAFDTKADIVPVVLDSWNIIRPGAYWIRDTVTTFRVMDTVRYEDYRQYSYKELAKLMRIKMTEELLRIRDERRAKQRFYYRKKQRFIDTDNEMRQELEAQKVRYADLLADRSGAEAETEQAAAKQDSGE